MTSKTDYDTDQLAPHSIEAEEAAIGAVLLDPDCYREAAQQVEAGDFFIVRHSWVWRAFEALAARGDPIEYLTVMAELEQMGKLKEVGGAAYLLRLINKTPSALNAAGYAALVARMATRRALIDTGSSLARLAHSDQTDIGSIIEQAGRRMSAWQQDAARHTRAAVNGPSEGYDEIEALVTASAEGGGLARFRCGWGAVDAQLQFTNDRLVYIFGQPGSGKSTLLKQWSAGLAANGARVLVFTFEETAADYRLGMACQRARVTASLVRAGRATPAQVDAVMQAAAANTALPIWIDDGAARTAAGIRAAILRAAQDIGALPDVIIIDTFERMRAARADSDVSAARQKSQALKDLAHDPELGRPLVIVAKQPNRKAAERADQRPEQGDMRDAGEEDADIVGGMYLPPEGRSHVPGLYVVKNRYGESGVIPMVLVASAGPAWQPVSTEHIDLD